MVAIAFNWKHKYTLNVVVFDNLFFVYRNVKFYHKKHQPYVLFYIYGTLSVFKLKMVTDRTFLFSYNKEI